MRIYFSGIGGVGIGPLSRIALGAGYDVCGSDKLPSLITDELEAAGIAISFDQSGEYLRSEHKKVPFDWFIHTAALPNNHPELVLARELGIKTSKRDELLAQIIADKNLKLIAIAGTHGKTTATSMLVWAMQQLQIPVSYSVGSTLSFAPSGEFNENSQFFVYECDEFDRNLLHFSPEISVITSVDYDHPDTYPTEKSYLEAFHEFGEKSKKVIVWQENSTIFNPKNLITLSSADQNITIPGEHNRKNATLIIEALKHMNISANKSAIYQAINSFPGSGRRFEKLADNLYSDYGHHPIEIRATLQMARELSDRVVLVYQPHQNVRQHEIIDQYTSDIFRDANEIYWLPTYLTRENPDLPILTPQQLTKNIGPEKLHFAKLDDNLWQNITTAQKSGKLVLCMGAGTIDGWIREQLAKD
jgi:UDP-N-acetylmuramate--L-alanine ligase